MGSTASPCQPWLQTLHEYELTAGPGIAARSRCCPGEPIKLSERRKDRFFPHTACALQPGANPNTVLPLFLLREGKSTLPVPGSSVLRTGQVRKEGPTWASMG